MGAASGALSAGGLAALDVQNTRLVQAGIDALLSAGESIYNDYTSNHSSDPQKQTSYSLGDYAARAVISAGSAFAFSYIGGGSDGSDMNKLAKEAGNKTAKSAKTATKYKKKFKLPKTAKKYLAAVKKGLVPTATSSAASTAANTTTTQLYKGAYDYYTR